jgi:penicillin-binding protein 1B
MNGRPGSSVAIALTAFAVIATAAQLALAHLYRAGVARVRGQHSLELPVVRILARPIRMVRGAAFPQARLAGHLRDIGYYEGCRTSGCYVSDEARHTLTVWGRYPELSDAVVRWNGDAVSSIAGLDGTSLDDALIEPETLLTGIDRVDGAPTRTSYDPVPLSGLDGTALFDAIVASEDRGFLAHHGIDFARLAATPFTHGGASTVTMQVARLNVLQDRSRTLSRKLNEIGVAMAMDRAFSKESVLEAYVNTVGLGARNGRPVQGFGAAAREFFGVRDVRQLTDLQAATLVALLNQPSRYLDRLSDGNEQGLRRQRNRVLALMHRTFPAKYPEDWAAGLSEQPVVLAPPPPAPESLYRLSRHFLDYTMPSTPPIGDGRIYLTLDPDRQRIAVDAVEIGLAALDAHVPAACRARLQAALIAVDPSTGEVLAMVGGRSYEGSQLNRAVNAHRQIGSLMKPFDYLAALERARAEGRRDLSPSATVIDRPAVFAFAGWRPWSPANYGHNYAGPITWRRALAESRNVAAVKVAALAGLNNVAALWEAASGTRLPQIYPSITLGAIEASPADVAAAYTIFATGGVAHPLRAIAQIASEHPVAEGPGDPPGRRVAAAPTTEAVTAMLRAVMDEGTGRGARAAGFTREAAGKTGTTNALRDAWFAGLSGRLLTVVWVGCDDGRPVGLTGAEAALPIWTSFMTRALTVVP